MKHRDKIRICASLVLFACGPTPEPITAGDSLVIGMDSAPRGGVPGPSITAGPIRAETDSSFDEDWIPGHVWARSKGQSRFLARIRKLSGDRLLLRLDSSSSGSTQAGVTKLFVAGDSLIVSGFRIDDTFTPYCGVQRQAVDGQVGGLVPRETPMQGSARPRLAWKFDTITIRIRPIVLDSVICFVPEETGE